MKRLKQSKYAMSDAALEQRRAASKRGGATMKSRARKWKSLKIGADTVELIDSLRNCLTRDAFIANAALMYKQGLSRIKNVQ